MKIDIHNKARLNQQTASGASTLTWATKGDLTGDGTLTYSYDTNNYLFAASNGSSQMYDGGGRLYSVGASAATRFAHMAHFEVCIGKFEAATTPIKL